MSDALYERFVPGFAQAGNTVVASTSGGGSSPVAPGEIPLLTPDLLKEIRAQLASEPDLTLELARRVYDRSLTHNELHRLLDELDFAFKNPQVVVASANLTAESGPALPKDFSFAGMESGAMFQHRPYDNKYEDSDKVGYGLNGAAAILKRVFVSALHPFRWHHDSTNQFSYTIPDDAKIALFADFGTGLAHSWYIGKFIAEHNPQLAIHLGDTYYAGRKNEQLLNFDAPLSHYVTSNSPSSGHMHELWVLAGNHDYYSGGQPFFEGIDQRRSGKIGSKQFEPHRQAGTYFALDSKAFKLIGIDVEYHSFFGVNPKYKEERLREWLRHHVVTAKDAGKSVILMSSDEPYSIGSEEITNLYHHITDDLPTNAIDLWFWGNTHYAAFFDHSDRLRSKFYGSCIGHGGFPYGTYNHLTPSPTHAAPYRWAETEPRFPKWTEVRPDMGNNGFVIMELADAGHSVKLNYYDWTNDLRCVVKLVKEGNQLVAKLIAGQKRDLRRKL